MVDEAIDNRFAQVNTVFFVVGAQKSGTSWIHNYFRSHPNVAMPEHKETNYWNALEEGDAHRDPLLDDRLRRTFRPKFRTRLRRLIFPWLRPSRSFVKTLKILQRAKQNPGRPHRDYADALFLMKTQKTLAVGEVCPQYAHLDPETYREMLALSDDVKFIYIMRDPLARFVSAVKHGARVRHGRKAAQTQPVLDAYVEGILKNRSGWGFHHSRYHEAMARLETAVPRDRVLYMFYEDLFRDTEISRLNTFLGIPDHAADFGIRVNHDMRPEIMPRPDLIDRARGELGEIYRAVAKKFGDNLPEAWQQEMRTLDDEVRLHA